MISIAQEKGYYHAVVFNEWRIQGVSATEELVEEMG